MKNNFYHSKRHLSLLFIFLMNSILFSFAQGFSPQTIERLQSVLDSFQNNPANPVIGGLSVAINVDGLAFWQGATGYAARNIDADNNLLPGGVPFTTATLSRIYSITKTFTAPLVLELAQEGYFSLDDPISKYMPQINLYNQNNINNSVTIRQLLNHTSGYSDWEEELNLQIAIAAQPTRIWTPYELVAYTHQIHPPGTVSSYSHNNYVFLGAIIEAATGRPVEQLYRERFFGPLHLTSMYFAGRESLDNRGVLASPHDNISPFNPVFQATGQPTFPDTTTNISRFPMDAIVSLAFTGGAIVSNVADVAKWGNDLFEGRATSKGVLDSMLQSISPVPDEFNNYLGYGIKRYIKISTKTEFLGHNGSAPGYRSLMVYNPQRKMTIAFLSNYAGIDPIAVVRALFEALPDFTCGNKNREENKVQVCFNGVSLCIPRKVAKFFIERGAYLGECSVQKVPDWVNHAASDFISQLWEQIHFIAYPNPFVTHLTLSFQVAQSGPVSLSLYNNNGIIVKMLFNGIVEKGVVKQVNMQAGNLPSGIYMVRLQTSSGISQRKVALIH